MKPGRVVLVQYGHPEGRNPRFGSRIFRALYGREAIHEVSKYLNPRWLAHQNVYVARVNGGALKSGGGGPGKSPFDAVGPQGFADHR